MRGSVLLVVLVAACSFEPPASTTGDDTPGAPDAGGGSSTTADAAVDAPDDLDDDDDGIADLVDNCPLRANPDQADEDADGQGGDACDPCPHLAAPQSDNDGDGIGDDCDPRPGQAGDELVVFEGFNQPGAPAGWSVLSGGATWSVSGGALRVTAGDTAAELVHALGFSGDHTIDARATITATGSGIVSAAVLADVTPAPTRFYLCATRTDQGEAELWRYSDPTWTDLGAAGGGGGTDLRMRLKIVGGSEACGVNTASVTSAGTTSNGSHVGVRARNMSVAFTSVAIYRSP